VYVCPVSWASDCLASLYTVGYEVSSRVEDQSGDQKYCSAGCLDQWHRPLEEFHSQVGILDLAE
jgi:hypothetical protein